MVLTGLLLKYFVDNISRFPDHVIHASKQDVLKIVSICFSREYTAVNLTNLSSIDLFKLVNLCK